MATFQVEIVSATASLLSVEASAVFAKSLDGEIGILPGHQPALLALDAAPVKIEGADGTITRVAVHNGFLYYGGDKLVVLANIAELAEDIDVPRAERRVEELKREDIEDESVKASLAKQAVRISVGE